ncbi:MAG TPA: hypothetical protein GXX40_07145 [Firmicutes bacterium]|nr:hypothetical protein [Bacillota bacterium]
MSHSKRLRLVLVLFMVGVYTLPGAVWADDTSLGRFDCPAQSNMIALRWLRKMLE